jgi:hypothetical protein
MRHVQVSREEQVSPQEYQEVTDKAITNHFIRSIRESRYQPSPIDLTQFYLREAIKYESQIKDKILREGLGDFLANVEYPNKTPPFEIAELSDRIH